MSGRAWRIYLAGGLVAVAVYFLLPLESMAILVAVHRHRPARPLI